MTLNLDKSTWKRVAFGDVVRNVNETVRDPELAGIDRIIAMEHMDPGELTIDRWGSLDEGTTFTRRVYPGQTLFGKRRAYQRKVAYAEFEAVCSGDILTFEVDEPQMIPEFLPFIVQCNEFFDHALDTSAGSLSPRTNWRDLSNFRFDLPPLAEQRRIADLLWAVEAASRSQSAVRRATGEVRQTWLNEQVSKLEKRKTVPFSQAWSRSPESGWSSVPVVETTGRYVLSLAALGPDGYRPGNLKNVSNTPQALAATLRWGDLLVSRANTIDAVGRVGIYPEDRSDVSFPDTMMRVSLADNIMSQFAVAVLASSHGRTHMRRSAAGSATSMVKINRTSLGRFRFPIASVEEQRALLAHLHHMESAIFDLDAELVALAGLRSSLLTAVFGGN